MSLFNKALAIVILFSGIVGCEKAGPTALDTANRGAPVRGAKDPERGKAIQEETIPPPPKK
jgi:hypothetical protein